MTKHIVCYSGGHSSALVAIEVCGRYGNENVVLLNHDISAFAEEADIKRFKQEVADYLRLPVTYANIDGLSLEELPDQFDVALAENKFKYRMGREVCTTKLKTQPFMKWLEENVPDKDCVVYYGFDANEIHRIQRRSGIMAAGGYKTDFPLALWKRTVEQTEDIGITRPNAYSSFKHANCVGCLKAGRQHWYVVYCTRPDIWEKAKMAEAEIGHHILKGIYLDELEDTFKNMKEMGVPATEHIAPAQFWKISKNKVIELKSVNNVEDFLDEKPCECIF